MLNEAVEQEPLRSTLAKACEVAQKEEGSEAMQEKLHRALREIRAPSAADDGETKVIEILNPIVTTPDAESKGAEGEALSAEGGRGAQSVPADL